MRKYQKDRVYSLIVGDKDEAVEINNLQIRFNVSKSSDNKNKKNSAVVEIYNLSESRRKSLEKPYVQVQLKVGWAGEDLHTLFTGQVVNISNTKIKSFLSRRNGVDVITKLNIDEMYSTLNHKIQSKVVPEGNTVRQAILTLIQDIPEISRHEMNGENLERVLPDGYPLHGSPQQNLDRISSAYDLEWQIDQGVLYVSDKFKSFMKDTSKVPLIGQMSGLIDAPEFISNRDKRQRQSVKVKNTDGEDKEVEPSKRSGAPNKDSLKLRILLNPTLTAGSYFKLDYPELSGYYRIDNIVHKGDFRGNEWYSEIVCSERLEG